MLAALLIAIIATSNNNEVTYIAAGSWLNNVLINVGSGLIIVVFLAILVNWFHIPNADEIEGQEELSRAGVRRLIDDWLRERPTTMELHDMFKNARDVQLLGVSLHNSLIGFEWFSRELARRLTDDTKSTQILLLDPNGNEIQRREAEGGGRRLKGKALSSRDQIQDGLLKAEFSDSHAILRFFDHAPTANLLRFDDSAYVVLLMYGRGGQSPALELRSGGWLFEAYMRHFEAMWRDQDR